MNSLFRYILLAMMVLPAAAQLAVPGTPSPSPSPSAAASEQTHKDPFDRGSPRSAIAAFIRAAHRNDWAAATRYAENVGEQAGTEQRLQGLNELMDRYFHQPLSTISDAPEGALDDGLPLNRERLGPLLVGGRGQYIELVRVNDPVAGPVWLISSDTLQRVPALRAAIERNWVERMLPAPFLAHSWFGFSLANLVVWAASLALPLALLRFLSGVGHSIVRRTMRDPARRAIIESWYAGLHWPVLLTLVAIMHLSLVPWFGPSLRFRILYSRVALVVVVALLAWCLQRFLQLVYQRASTRLQFRGRAGTRSLMLLGERLLKVLIGVVSVLVMLAIGGFDIKTALAGLGIVGFAVALGAQKTVENILGGMLLLGDEAIAIGDLCCVSDRLGVVEDITLRSVRIRTLEQTVLSIPAGVLAQASIENFASRGKMLAQTTLRLAHDTSCQQLRVIREEIAELLAKNARIETESSRVRLVGFTLRGVELELFAYILTADMQEFLAVREELLLQVASVVERAGSTFARPCVLLEEPGSAPAAALSSGR